jgi:hypothetical protein
VGSPCTLEIRSGPYLMFVLMFNTAYIVDEIFFLLAMDWAYEVFIPYVTMTYVIH